MHLLVSLTAHGWHPAAWRVTRTEGFAAATPFRTMVQTAERGMLDAVLLGLPAVTPAERDSGRVDVTRLDPLPLLGAMIGASRCIGLGAYWPADVAEPYHVARVFATLDHLAGGRTAWITGLAGSEELGARYGHVTFPPTLDDASDRLAELIDVTRQLWDSWEDRGFMADQASGTFADPAHVHPIDHSGPFFMVRGPLNVPRPVQGQPVIMQTDVSPGSPRVAAAASAEVILSACDTIAQARALRAEWRGLAAEYGRQPDSIRLIARVTPILDETEAGARRRAVGLDALSDDHAARQGLRFIGTPDGFADLLTSWKDAGACDGFEIRPAVLPTDLDLFVGSVVPILRARGQVRSRYAHATLREHLHLHRAQSRFAA
jgi:alkanesulfonate monooxygenase SsuD/methylene tetrahydromethanopterin reductase-like flavin-dependent oxidoreductase (luciferase family)